MDKLKLLTFPDRALRAKAARVEAVTEEVRQLAVGLHVLMREHDGAAIAAPQAGVLQQVIVVEDPANDEPFILINPEIVSASKEKAKEGEGCLSVPGVTIPLLRPKSCTVRSLGLDGESTEKTFTGLLARAVLHEMDHLEGRLIIDYLGAARRDAVKAMLLKKAKRR